MQCRVAPSLGALEDTPENVWKTTKYTDRDKPCVFFGLYDLRDYIALFRHRGKAYILWAGSDIRNLVNGFIFNDGKLGWLSKVAPGFKKVLKKVLKDAEHWVENMVEEEALMKWGLKDINVCPSYLGRIGPFMYYNAKVIPDVYVSCGKERQVEYGFDVIERIADKVDVTFHLYGDEWETKHKNVIVHGRVSKEKMNKEIQGMQCGLRLNKFDGFSEITAKSILWGQYPITRIPYRMIDSFNTDDELITLLNNLNMMTPNMIGRHYYVNTLNKFPWNESTIRGGI